MENDCSKTLEEEMLERLKRLALAATFVANTFMIPWAAIAGNGGGTSGRALDRWTTKITNASTGRVFAAVPKPMLDPSMDDGEIFSYFKMPSYQLGIRGEPQATQVMEGHLWTGAAEWLLLAGDELEPVNQRIWTLRKGYLPCIEYEFSRDGADYHVAAFQYHLGGGEGSPPANFIRVTVKNPSDIPLRTSFASAMSYGPRDHRCQRMRQMRFNPFWTYSVEGRTVRRGGKILAAWRTPPAETMARRGKQYGGPFIGAGRTEPVCLAVYRPALGPGESESFDFVVPHYPAEAGYGKRIESADYGERLAAFDSFWESWLGQGATFTVSEDKVNHAIKSYVVHILMSQDVVGPDEVEQHVNRLHYNRFWLRDSSFFVYYYENFGYSEIAGKLARHFHRYQREYGNYLSQPGQLDGWGQSMWALGNHVRYTGDADFAREALPHVERAAGWLESEIGQDDWGLMPPTNAMDNETIAGRYTGHSFWVVTGLDAAADLARAAGRPDLADKYGRISNEYRDRFLAKLRQVAAERDGVIPPGLDVPGGTDWGNLLAVFPGRVMDPHDPLVTATFDRVREDRMEEGISMWHSSLHHYITERIAQTAVIRGEQEKAVSDFYGMLLHTGSCHEGFEWTVWPWNGRDYCMDNPVGQTCNYPPHGWYAANMSNLFRNMLLREDGGELHLLSAISPEWAKPGDEIRVGDAPAWFRDRDGVHPGVVSYTARFESDSAVIEIGRLDFADASPKVVVHVPYFLKARAARAGGNDVPVAGGVVVMPEGTRELSIEFERQGHEPRSYKDSVEWYKSEYRRRYEETRK